jgi:hypothetical protein
MNLNVFSKKHISGLIGVCLIALSCNAQEKPLYQADDFSILEIYEGTNKYYIPAIIVETEELLDQAKAIRIRDFISTNKEITEHSVEKSTIVFKKSNKVYAILSKDRFQKPYKDIFLSLDSIKSNIQKRLAKKKEKPNMEDCYLFLGTNNFREGKDPVFYWLKPEETNYDADSLNYDYYWINSTGYRNEIKEEAEELIVRDYTVIPKEEGKLIRLESGDIVKYSFRNKGYTSYFLRLKD